MEKPYFHNKKVTWDDQFEELLWWEGYLKYEIYSQNKNSGSVEGMYVSRNSVVSKIGRVFVCKKIHKCKISKKAKKFISIQKKPQINIFQCIKNERKNRTNPHAC